MNKLLTKIVGAALGVAMTVGVGVAVASNQNVAKTEATETLVSMSAGSNSAAVKVNYNSSGAPAENHGVRIGTSKNNGSATFSVPSGTTSFGFSAVGWKGASVTVNLAASVGTPSASSVSLTANDAATGSINANATVAITGTDANCKKSFTISNVTASSTITISSGSGDKRSIVWDAWYEIGGGSGPTALANPNPQYNDNNKTVSWTTDANATKYQIKVDSGSYTDIATETYDASGLSVGNQHTVYIKAVGDETNYSSTEGYVTFTPTAPFESKEYVLIKSTDDLIAGCDYLIGGSGDNNGYFISTNQASNNRTATSGTVSNETVNSTSSMQVITLGGSTGAWTLHATGGTNEGFLYTASTSSNRLHTRANDSDNNSKWAITVSDAGLATIHNVGNTDRGEMSYNANNGNPIFNCYASGGNLCIYKLHVSIPTITVTPEIEMTLGESVPSISVTEENFSGTPTYAWTSSDEDVATISGTTSSPTITVKAAGTTTLSATATYSTESASGSCILTVHAVPTEVQVKVGSSTATSETILSQFVGRTRTPTVNILPEGADQGYSLSVQSETVEGAFTVSGKVISFVKVATGVIRFTSTKKNSVYFDLHVSCDADGYVENTFTYAGTVSSEQYEGTKFNADGLTFKINKLSDPSNPKTVDLSEVSFSPSVLTLSTTSITATHTESGQTVNIPVTVSELVTTPLSDFYDGTIDVSSETSQKTFKGTCIGIVGNSYYIQEGNYGMYIYNHATTGLEVGKMVLVSATVKTYNHLVETGTVSSAEVIGDGALPAGQIVNSYSAFSALNQSIYASFDGLNINNDSTSYTSINWTQQYTSNSSDGVASVYDSDGAEITIFVSKYVANGSAIVTALNAITADQTFDIEKGVVAVSTKASDNGKKQLSIMRADQITTHDADEDLIISWADDYLYMQDPTFNGNGSGRCKTDSLYLTAKRALIALGSSLVNDFQNNTGSKYTAQLARYNAWAAANGDTSPFAGNDIVPAQEAAVVLANSNSGTAAIVAIVSVITLSAVAGYFMLRKRKEQ